MSEKSQKKSAAEIVELAIVSLFGAGFSPFASGTVGSAVALLVFFLPVSPLDFPIFLLAISAICFIVGTFLVNRIEKKYGDDPSIVVLDEAVGMWLVLASPRIDWSPVWVILGFLLFRFFDIVKVFPANYFDNKRGGFNVMADDVVAAIYASICLHVFYAGSLALPLVMRFLGH